MGWPWYGARVFVVCWTFAGDVDHGSIRRRRFVEIFLPSAFACWFYDGCFIEKARKTCRKLTRLLHLQVQFYWSRRYSRTLPIRNNRLAYISTFFFQSCTGCLSKQCSNSSCYFFIIGDSNCVVRGRQLWSSTQLSGKSWLWWDMGENLSGKRAYYSISRIRRRL